MNKQTAVIVTLFFATVLAVLALLPPGAEAVETSPRFYDASIMRVQSSSTFVDVSAADYTSYQTLLTITPQDNFAMNDVKVHVDLDQGDGNDGFAGGYTSETIRFAVARRFQSANWRTDNEEQTSTITGTLAGDRSITLDLGVVGPNERARIMVLVSTEQGDIELPYVMYYRAGASATFVDVAN